MAPPAAGKRDVVWADGLRGVASILVVTAHITRSLVPHLLAPAMSEKLPPSLMQLPFLRCLVMGRASVAEFALLSGWVNSLSPLKKARAGNYDAALQGVAKSAFRRTGRFVIPAVFATTISWLLCQFGAYRIANISNSDWIRDTSPGPSHSFALAFYDLFRALGLTWINGSNEYDRIQWTLTFLLKGSMMTYLFLFATVYVKPKWRMALCAALYYFKWKSGDALVGFNIFCGIFLAEVSLDADIQEWVARHPYLRSVVSASLIILGLFLCSYPESKPEWARWSNAMMEAGHWIFPKGVEYARYYPGLGANVLTVGIMFNTTAKSILSQRLFLFLGKLSWPVYLLHAPLIRTVLTWVLFGFSKRKDNGVDDKGHKLPPGWLPVASNMVIFIALPLFYVFLYRVANLWATYVDPIAGKITQSFEDAVFRDEAKSNSEKPLLLS